MNHGKTALPKNKKSSDFSSKTKVLNAFNELISNSKFDNIFVSYNTDGIVSEEEMVTILKDYYEDISIERKEYKRFKADTSNDREYDKSKLEELIFIGLNRK